MLQQFVFVFSSASFFFICLYVSVFSFIFSFCLWFFHYFPHIISHKCFLWKLSIVPGTTKLAYLYHIWTFFSRQLIDNCKIFSKSSFHKNPLFLASAFVIIFHTLFAFFFFQCYDKYKICCPFDTILVKSHKLHFPYLGTSETYVKALNFPLSSKYSLSGKYAFLKIFGQCTHQIQIYIIYIVVCLDIYYYWYEYLNTYHILCNIRLLLPYLKNYTDRCLFIICCSLLHKILAW